MPWAEDRPGIYQRPMGHNEQFIQLVGDRAHALGREHWSVTSLAAFDLAQALDEDELVRQCHRAWQALRFQHPSIASQASDSMLTYEIPDCEALKTWVEETFHTYSAKISADEMIASLRPSRYATAHLILAEPAIVLHLPHWRTDGYGALHLINAFLKHLSSIISSESSSISDLAWGQEINRLVPSIEELLNLPQEATPETNNLARKYLSTAALSRGAVGLSPTEGMESNTIPPRGTRSTGLQFSSTETAAIQDACKTRDISLLAAIQASCATATYAGATFADQRKPYTGTIRLNLRPHMPAPYDGAAFASGLCTGGYFEQIPSTQSWSENAMQYSNAYRVRGVTDEFLTCRRQYAIEVLKMLAGQDPAAPTPASSEIDISHVGDVEEQRLVAVRQTDKRGKTVLEVRKIRIGVETVSRQMYCFVWIFRGRLEFSLVWNEAFYDEARATQLVRKIGEVLVARLGIRRDIPLEVFG
ncbi:MAG: hypothetical protein Q9169_007298 [Polycauliona sp. 2 TL-2023]